MLTFLYTIGTIFLTGRQVILMGATIKDVARLAGVSIATVSRVINDKGIVAPEKEKQVLAAVKELRYTPNAIAQSLKQKKSKLIGMMASDMSVSFFVGVLKILEQELLESGYQMIVANTYDSPDMEGQLIELMTQGRCDILLINSTGGNDDRLAELKASGVKMFGYDRYPKNGAFPSVYLDKVKGTYMLLSHLYDLGHRRFCMITGSARLSTNIQRCQGVELFLKEKNLPKESVQIRQSAFSGEYAQEVLSEMCKKKNPPTAYIAGSEATAIGIMQYCERHGLSIPGDISLACFGDFRNSDLIRPSLLYIDDQYRAVAYQLLEWIRITESGDGEIACENVVLEPKLVLGDSCAPPK